MTVAKPRPDKAQVIREAILANPGLRTASLVELLNDSTDRLDDRLIIIEADVQAVRKTMKKARTAPPPVAPPPEPPAVAAPAETEPAPARQPRTRRAEPEVARPSPVDLIDKVFDLAKECGGFEQLKRLVDRIAEIRRR